MTLQGLTISGLVEEVLQGWRSTRRRPGAWIPATAVLGLAIGLTTLVFCLADPFLFRALPYDKPDELAVLSVRAGPLARLASEGPALTLEVLEGRKDLFASVAGYRRIAPLRLAQDHGSAAIRAAEVSRQFFTVLRISASWPDDAAVTRDVTPIWLTRSAATRLLGNAPAIGTRLPRYGGGVVSVAGVLPADFVLPSNSPLFTIDAVVPAPPLKSAAKGSRTGDRGTPAIGWTILGRLRQGVSAAQVQSALSTGDPAEEGVTVHVTPLTTHMTGRFRRLAFGALTAGLLLFALCVGNFLNMLLARTVYRAPDLRTRAVLGAGRGHLARLLGVEVTLVTVASVAIGLMLAWAALIVSRGVTPAEYLALGEPQISRRTVLVAVSLGAMVQIVGIFAATWLCRLVPSWVTAPSLAFSSTRVRWMRRAMIAVQSGFGLLLVLGALVLVRSYVNLVTQRTGFLADSLVATVSYPDDYGGAPLQFDIDSTLARLAKVPGVMHIGAAKGALIDRTIVMAAAVVRGQVVPTTVKQVTPEFFAAVGANLTAGRDFRRREAPGVAVVNATFATRYFPTGDAVGAFIGAGDGLQIVGVVSDMLDVSLDRQPEPAVFQILDRPKGCRLDCNRVHYVIRLMPNAADVSAVVARTIGDVNRTAVVVEMTAIGERLLSSVRDRAFAAVLLALFAVTGVGVCVTGLIGIIAFMAKRRTSEIAIRMALGASPYRVLRTLIGETILSVVSGILAGLVVWLWTLSAFSHLSYGAGPDDTWTILIAVVAMTFLAFAGAATPAIRTLRVSPWRALRVE